MAKTPYILPKEFVPGYSTTKKPTIPVVLNKSNRFVGGLSTGIYFNTPSIIYDAVSQEIIDHVGEGHFYDDGYTVLNGNLAASSSQINDNYYIAVKYNNLSAGSFRVKGSLTAYSLGSVFSLRVVDSSTNTLCWRNSDYALNLRINGSTVVLTSSQQIYGAGEVDILIQWDDANNTRELFVNGILEDSDSTSFVWADEANNLIRLCGDGSGAGFLVGDHLLLEVRESLLTEGNVTELYRNPYQILKPAIGTVYFTADAGGGVSIEIPAHNIELTSYAPTISASAGVSTEVPASNIGLTSHLPNINISDHKSVTIPARNLELTSYLPTVTATDHKSIEIVKHDLSITGYAPLVTTGDAIVIEVPVNSITLTSYAPTISADVDVNIGKHDLTITSYVPTISADGSVTTEIPLHNLELTSYAPEVSVSDEIIVIIPAHDLNLQSYPPSIVVSSSYSGVIPKTDINLTSYVPLATITGAFNTADERIYTQPAINRVYTHPAINRIYTVKRK